MHTRKQKWGAGWCEWWWWWWWGGGGDDFPECRKDAGKAERGGTTSNQKPVTHSLHLLTPGATA